MVHKWSRARSCLTGEAAQGGQGLSSPCPCPPAVIILSSCCSRCRAERPNLPCLPPLLRPPQLRRLSVSVPAAAAGRIRGCGQRAALGALPRPARCDARPAAWHWRRARPRVLCGQRCGEGAWLVGGWCCVLSADVVGLAHPAVQRAVGIGCLGCLFLASLGWAFHSPPPFAGLIEHR